MFNPLRSIFESRTVRKAPLHTETHSERNGVTRPSYIIYRLKSEVSITLRCRLCSTHYHNSMDQELFDKHLCYQNSHYEKYGQFPLRKGKPSHAIAKSTLFAVSTAKMNGTQRRTLVSP